MKATAYIGGKYMTKESVEAMKESEKLCVIDHVTEEMISGQRKLVLFLEGHDVGLPLNTTRIESLIEIHGGVEDTDEWRGTKVKLGVDPSVRYQGKRVGGIKIDGA